MNTIGPMILLWNRGMNKRFEVIDQIAVMFYDWIFSSQVRTTKLATGRANGLKTNPNHSYGKTKTSNCLSIAPAHSLQTGETSFFTSVFIPTFFNLYRGLVSGKSNWYKVSCSHMLFDKIESWCKTQSNYWWFVYNFKEFRIGNMLK